MAEKRRDITELRRKRRETKKRIPLSALWSLSSTSSVSVLSSNLNSYHLCPVSFSQVCANNDENRRKNFKEKSESLSILLEDSNSGIDSLCSCKRLWWNSITIYHSANFVVYSFKFKKKRPNHVVKNYIFISDNWFWNQIFSEMYKRNFLNVSSWMFISV